MINVTPLAAEKIGELLTEEQKTGAGLRVFVQGGGCSGFQYGMMIEESPGATDQVLESNGVKLYVGPISVSRCRSPPSRGRRRTGRGSRNRRRHRKDATSRGRAT